MCLYEPELYCRNKFPVCEQSWEHLRILVSTQRELQWIWGHFGSKWVWFAHCWQSIDGFVLFLMVSRRHMVRVMVSTGFARPISGAELKRQPEKNSFCCEWLLCSLPWLLYLCVSECVCGEWVKKSRSDCSYLWKSVHQSDWTVLLWDSLDVCVCVWVACEVADICCCTQGCVWICMTRLMWISAKRQSVFNVKIRWKLLLLPCTPVFGAYCRRNLSTSGEVVTYKHSACSHRSWGYGPHVKSIKALCVSVCSESKWEEVCALQ